MSHGGLAKLADVWAMLEDCAPGHNRDTRGRNYCIRYNGFEYPRLPLGAPSDKRREVELYRVKHMAQQLQLKADCVNRHFPNLLKKK